MGIDISVIIATYNVEPYIERAIQSALDQQGVTLEIIVVDDRSTDKTWEILTAKNDLRLRCIRHETNQGPGATRNTAIAQANGKWLAILDGDDAFLPDRLERCIACANASNANIVVDNLSVFREEGGATFPMFPSRFSQLNRLDLPTLIKGKLSWRSSYTLGYLKPIFSADFLRQNSLMYETNIPIGEDYLLLAQALAAGAHCAVEPTAGYLYTARKGSISYRLSCENITRMLEADAKYLAHYPIAPKAAKAQKNRERMLKKERAFALLVLAIKQRNPSKILQAIVSNPPCLLLLWRPLWVRIKRLI